MTTMNDLSQPFPGAGCDFVPAQPQAQKGKIDIGTTLVNNDPRSAEVVKVIAILYRGGNWYAMYQGKTRKCSIRFDRIHTDGKQRNQGWRIR